MTRILPREVLYSRLFSNIRPLKTVDEWLTICTGWDQIAKDEALVDAAEHNEDNKVEALLAAGSNVNARYKLGTALHWAAINGHPRIAKMLLECGANTNIRKRETQMGMPKNAPLHFAASAGWIDVVRLLLAYGAKVDIKNNHKETPLHEVADTSDTTGGNPLLRRKTFEIVKLLLDSKAEIDAQNDGGRTPLRMAARRGRTDIAELLVKRGADLSILYDGWLAPVPDPTAVDTAQVD